MKEIHKYKIKTIIERSANPNVAAIKIADYFDVEELERQRDDLLDRILKLNDIYPNGFVNMLKWWNETFKLIESIIGLSWNEIKERLKEVEG